MLVSTYSLLLGVLIVLLALCCLSVIGRVYVRAYLLRTIDVGDYCMVLTLLIFIPYWALVCVCLNLGLGSPVATLGQEDYDHILKVRMQSHLRGAVADQAEQIFYFGEILYACLTCTLKLSIGLLLLRFATTRKLRLVVFITTIAYCIYAIGLLLIMSLQCVPAARFWDTSITSGGCIPRRIFTDLVYIHAANSIITDGIYSFLPVALIWNMQIERSVKLSLIFVLGLGVL